MADSPKRQLDTCKTPDIRYKKLFADNNKDTAAGNEWTLREDNSGDESRLLEGNSSGNESSSNEEDPGTSTTRLTNTDWDKGSNCSLLSNLGEREPSSDFEDKTVAPKQEDRNLQNHIATARGSLSSWSSAQSLIVLDGIPVENSPHCAVEMDGPLATTTHDATAAKEEESWRQSTSSVRSATRLATGNVQASTGRPRERVAAEPAGNGHIRTSDVVPVILWDDFPERKERKSASSTSGSSNGGDRDPLGYDIYARSIAEVVTDERTEMPLTVGVYGEFGMGKTHLLGQVKDEVNGMIEKKKQEDEECYKAEVDGLKQNRKRKQKHVTHLPVVIFSELLVAFLSLLIATVVCAVYYQGAWEILLPFTILAFVLLMATVIHAYSRSISQWCRKRLKNASPLHWMVGVHLDWVEPPVMSETPQPERYEVIWVHFNAWEFSGCKVLWAGIVTTLCDAIEAKIGATPARFYRVIKSQVEGWNGGKKSLLKCAWFKFLLAAVLGVILASLVGIFVLKEGTEQLTAVIATVSQVLGLGIVVNIKGFFKVAKNLVKSQKDILKGQMKKPDFAEQLGFMSEVKSEVQTVTSLLRFLEHVTGVQYRVIIVVDDLDCCPGDRVVDVLQAMNILLSDKEAKFVSIVAMDPKIVVNCLESHLTETMINNYSGYEYLKRIQSQKGADFEFKDEVDGDFNIDFLGDVIQVIVQDDDDDDINDIMFYVHGNAHHITNIYHVLGMTVKVLKHRKHLQFVSPRQVASWVVLAEQWPYRLSWVLQFVEDSQQNESIRQRSRLMTSGNESARRLSLVSQDASLFKVFEMVKPEMARIDPKDFARLNNLDADPEMFELLLVESRFTVQDMMTLLPCTINLDWSIQRRIAVARSLSAGDE